MKRRAALACWICIAFGLTLAALLAAGPSARAAWPPVESPDGGTVNYEDRQNQPNDPGYPGQWNYFSYAPSAWKARLTEQNRRLGIGSHVDRAWARTTGDWRIKISVLDSGSNWSNGDLANKYWLNDRELPAPTDCPGADGTVHDVNKDGRFNVQDYTTLKGRAIPAFDKVCDKRLLAKGDANRNGIVDPQDLIAAFSDGKDDDANGYVDDISGWDFFRNDNDPFDDTGYGHGNGEANDSAAEGDNGNGGVGTCPDCSVQLLRVGDSFVADGNDFGMAALYAVDSGSSVIQEALGTIDHTLLAREAIEYAYKNNVVVIASAADENSYHHNFPGTNLHTYYVHAITHDAAREENSTTFLNFNNCTNYGAQLSASVPGDSCSSEAVGRFSGMAALVYAAALEANIPAPPDGHAGDPGKVRRLRTEEAYQLFRAGIDDLYDPADATDPTRYPTRVGFEQRFGYGRVNARRSVDLVLDGRIPPETDLTTPEWFEVIDPARTPKLEIKGRVAFRNAPGDKFADAVDWVMEWAPGIEPEDKDFKVIAEAQMMPRPMTGTLASWDISGITVDNPKQDPPDNHVNRFMVTLRLRATARSVDPKHDGVKSETRRALFLHRDPTMLAGFPLRTASQESSPKIVDLNGDGKRELVVGDSAGFVYALGIDGKNLPGWPVRARLIPALDSERGASHAGQLAFTKAPDGEKPMTPDYRSAVLATPAVGDVDGDKKPEVVVADYDGNVYVFKADGKLAPGWPREVDRSIVAERGKRRHPAAVDDGVFASPALADFDGDGDHEIVVADMVGQVNVWQGDGTKLPNFPVRVWDTRLPDDAKADAPRQLNRILSSPALGDLDRDGVPDIVVGTNEDYDNQGRLYAISGKTGQILPGWPTSVISIYILPVVGSGMPNAVALADMDGDKRPEVIIGAIGGAVKMYTAEGKPFGRTFPNTRPQFGPKSNAKDPNTFAFISNPAVGDIDDDGVLDVAYPTVGEGALLSMATGGTRHDYEMHLSVWDGKTSAYKPGFPQVMEDYQFFNNPIFADIDGDGRIEVLSGSAGYHLHAFRADGSEPTGWPKFTGQWIAASPAVGDMDGDGKLEVALGTRDGWLYAWRTEGRSDGRIDWDSFHHDARNTGNFDTPLDQGRRAAPGGDPGDCGCRVGGRAERAGSDAAGAAFALVTLVAAAGLGRLISRTRARRRRVMLDRVDDEVRA